MKEGLLILISVIVSTSTMQGMDVIKRFRTSSTIIDRKKLSDDEKKAIAPVYQEYCAWCASKTANHAKWRAIVGGGLAVGSYYAALTSPAEGFIIGLGGTACFSLYALYQVGRIISASEKSYRAKSLTRLDRDLYRQLGEPKVIHNDTIDHWTIETSLGLQHDVDLTTQDGMRQCLDGISAKVIHVPQRHA